MSPGETYSIFLIGFLWSLAWALFGFLISEKKLNKPHVGLFLGLLFGPFVLLLLLIPTPRNPNV